MKRKNFKVSFASLVVILLVGVMCISTAFASFTGNTAVTTSIGSTNSAVSAGADDIDIKLGDVLDPDKIEYTGTAYKDSDKVCLIITMNDTSLVDIWLANPQGYTSFSDYRKSLAGRNAAENLIKKQDALFNKIARNEDVTLKYNYVNVMNGFAIEINYGDRDAIDSIAYKANVKNTVLSTHFDAPQAEEVIAVENEVTAYDTGIFDSEASIYDRNIAGQGTVVAILDTGIDWEHVAFSPEHPLFNLEEQKENGTLRYQIEDIQELLDNGSLLSDVRTRIPDEDEDPYSAKITAKDLYRNDKVIFGFDYADKDNEVSTDIDNSHGTHVAGIIAGHSDTPYEDKEGNIYLKGKGKADGENIEKAYKQFADKFYVNKKGHLTIREDIVEVDSLDSDEAKAAEAENKIPVVKIYDDKTKKQITGITGVAPQAQLAIFKVFSDFSQGAHSESLYSALEDCITLGVDTINMSLGSDSGFQEDEGALDSVYEVYEKVGKVGISLVVAASNSYSSSFSSHAGLNLISNPDSATVGSPSTFDAAISVASISGVKSKYLAATNGLPESDPAFERYGIAYYADAAHMNSESYDFMEDLIIAIKAKGLNDYIVKKKDADGNEYETYEVPYVTILGTGVDANYAGKNVKDKIALVQRGVSSFEDKIKIAQAKGALACIIYNNVAGIIRMQVGDNVRHNEEVNGEKINFPACSITMDDAVNIRNKDVMATGGITPKFVFDPKAEAGPFMSEFSSWGPLPNLLLKPEITAHGGDIYSSVPGNETSYARMSGTSMACPNMAGVVTLLRSYMRQEENVEKFDLWAYKYDEEADGSIKLDAGGNRVYKYENNQKIKLTNDKGENYVDDNVLEQRIYQILMSTATIANDERNIPYSPRRQGAGLADLNRSETTEQYLFVKDKEGNEAEHTKLELLDDPTKSGKYTMEFYARNVGSTDQSYTISADILTEGKSSDGKTVSEKAERLTGTPTLTVDNDVCDLNNEKTAIIKVGAGQTVKIVYEFQLDATSKAYLDTFPNGMYVEGFVRLTNVNENGINLNVPFLAFYGNWADAPIFDYDIFETSKDLNDDNIDDDYKRYSNTRELQVVGKIVEDDVEYALGLGQFSFALPEGMDAPDVEEDKCSLSYNEDTAMFNIYCVGGFLRGVKKMFYQITDVETGEVLLEDVYYSARKAAAAGSMGGAWIDVDIKALNLMNNSQYQLSIYPVLDWKAENYPSDKEHIQSSIDKIVSEGEEWNRLHANDGRSKRYSWSCKFWVDSDAPFVSDTQIRVDRDRSGNATYYLDLYLTDNHYICGMGLYVYDKDQDRFLTALGDGLRPITSDRNTTTRVSYNITNMWEQINEGLLLRMADPAESMKDAKGRNYTEFQMIVYDYALNASYYTIDLMELLQADLHTEVKIGDTGNYNTYSANGESVKVLLSTNREINKDANNNNTYIDQLTIVPGQKVSLKNAIVSFPSTAWRDELEFTVSGGNDIIRFDDETYELYAVRQRDANEGEKLERGHATLTITSHVTDKVLATLDVYVLTNEEVARFGIDTTSLREKEELTGMTFKEGNFRTFNAGETYIIEAEPTPWFLDYDPEKYFIGWSSNFELIGTVAPLDKDDPEYAENGSLKAKITANAALRDKDGNYISGYEKDSNGNDDLTKPIYTKYKKNFAQSFDVTATMYKVIPAEQYNEKNNNHYYDPVTGRYGEKVGTGSTFTGAVQEEFVVEGNTLTEYHGAGGNVVIPDNLSITIIGDMVFMNRNDITSVTIPEGVETINRAAFAYMENLERVKLPSTIQTVGEFAFCARYDLDDAAPTTRLMVIDTSDCVKIPWKAGRNAFAMQRYVGIDIDASHITDLEDSLEPNADKKAENEYVLLNESERELLNTSMLRLAGPYSFYGMRFANDLDFTGLRSAGMAAFYEYGAGYIKYPSLGTCNAIFGEHTMSGLAAFVAHGIKTLTLPMRRVNEQMFFGSTIVRLVDKEAQIQEVAAIYGALDEVIFTADDLIIENAAFVYSTVNKVTFSGSVESIGEAAFYGCKNLESVTFEKECKDIGLQAFAGTSITEFTLPKGLETLGIGAFANCGKLTTVKIDPECKLEPASFANSEDVYASESAPFGGCNRFSGYTLTSGEKSGSINNGKLTLKDGVLYGNNEKRIVSVPAGYTGNVSDIFKNVEEIGAYAFGGVKLRSAAKVDLSGTNVKIIENGAFYGSDIQSIKLNDKITSIGDAAFLGSTLNSIDFGDNNVLTKIGRFAFYNTSTTQGYLKEVTLPASLTEIGELAFVYQYNLEKVTFKGDQLKTIGDGAFFNTSISEIDSYQNGELKKNTLFAESIGMQAFVHSLLVELNLPRVKNIGTEAFYACYMLETITMPNVKVIGEGAFRIFSAEDGNSGEPTSSLTNVILSEENGNPKLEEIGKEAFRDNPTLKNIDLSTVKVIGEGAFRGSKLENVGSLDSVETIGDFAFAQSTIAATNGGETFKLPATLTKVGGGAFAGSMVKKFEVEGDSSFFADDAGVLYNRTANGKYELVAYPTASESKEYTVIDNTVKIGAYSFAFGDNLNTIDISADVTRIGDGAFYDASIAEYKFVGLNAPELETTQESFTNDYRDAFWWQLYRNFKGYFSYNQEGEPYKYNPIRQRDESDIITDMVDEDGLPIDATVNTGYTKDDGFDAEVDFGIKLYYPANARGFDTFVWSHYFDEIEVTAEVKEPAVDEVNDLIDALPDPNGITAASREDVINARAAYESLSSDAQRAFVDRDLLSKLVACENALAAVVPENPTYTQVAAMIEALPEAESVTLDNKDAILAARKAYDALSDDDKKLITEAQLAKLVACEEKLDELEGNGSGCGGCGGCGTVDFGSGNGTGGFGGGLMVGLIIVALALTVVFVPKKRRNK